MSTIIFSLLALSTCAYADKKLNINCATLEDLKQYGGPIAHHATEILKRRPFKRIMDLRLVPGLGMGGDKFYEAVKGLCVKPNPVFEKYRDLRTHAWKQRIVCNQSDKYCEEKEKQIVPYTDKLLPDPSGLAKTKLTLIHDFDDGKQAARVKTIRELVTDKVLTIEILNHLPQICTAPRWSILDFKVKSNIAKVVFRYYYLKMGTKRFILSIKDGKTDKQIGKYAPVQGGLKLNQQKRGEKKLHKNTKEYKIAKAFGYSNALSLIEVFDEIERKGMEGAKQTLFYLESYAAFNYVNNKHFQCSHNFKVYRIAKPYVVFYQNDSLCHYGSMFIALVLKEKKLTSVRKGQWIYDAVGCNYYRLLGIQKVKKRGGPPMLVLESEYLELKNEHDL